MADPVPQQRPMSALAWLLMAGLALIWGGSFLANRIALVDMPVVWIVALRVAVGAAALWLWVAARRLPLPRTRRALAGFAAMGLLNNILPFSLIVWGQKHVPSGLAGILNASTAIFGVVVAAAVFRDERLGRRRLLGVALGFAGVVVALGPEALSAFDPAALGQIAILGAALSYAFAAALGRVVFAGLRPEVAAAGTLSASALGMLPAALVIAGPPRADWAPASWAAVLYLALAASALAYILYFRILALAGAGNLSLVTLLIVPVAIVLGALVFGEALTGADYAGFVLLAAGMVVIDGRLAGKVKKGREFPHATR